MKIQNKVTSSHKKFRFGRLATSHPLNRQTLKRWLMGVVIGGVLGAAIVGIRSLLLSNYFLLREIKVVFLSKAPYNMGTTKKDILSLLDLNPGMKLFQVDLPLHRRKLLSHPWIRDVTIKRILPSTLQIGVHEKSTLALLHQDDLYYLDAEGNIIGRAEEYLDLPVITIRKATAKTNLEEAGSKPSASLIPMALHVLDLGQRLNLEISELIVSSTKGISFVLNREKTVVQLGYEPFEEKMDRLMEIRKDMVERWIPYSMVDVSFEDKAIVRTLIPIATTPKLSMDDRNLTIAGNLNMGGLR